MDKYPFPICKKCSKRTSKSGNYTNMFLLGIHDPQKYEKQYGMMCGDHAAQITRMIMRDKNLTREDFADAHLKALKLMDEELLPHRDN